MFAKANARAIGICSRTVSELQTTRDEIGTISPDTQVYLQRVDVGCEEDVKSFFDQMKTAFGTIDVLVSNAGANSCFEHLINTSTELWWSDFVSEISCLERQECSMGILC